MLSKIKMLMGAAVMIAALPATAATVSTLEAYSTGPDSRGTVVVTLDGTPTFIGGNLRASGSDDWMLDFQPDNDATATTVSLGFDPTVNGLGLYESGATTGPSLAHTWKLIASAASGGTFVSTIVGSKDYFLRVIGRGAGTNGSNDLGSAYNAKISAVPIPAAAWLFLSVLAGYGLLGRRNNVQGAAIA